MDTTANYISKESVLNTLHNMPDQIPLDLLLDEIIYLYKVQAALSKSQHEKGHTIDEFRQKVQTWGK